MKTVIMLKRLNDPLFTDATYDYDSSSLIEAVRKFAKNQKLKPLKANQNGIFHPDAYTSQFVGYENGKYYRLNYKTARFYGE